MGRDTHVGQSPNQVTEVGRMAPAARTERTIQRKDTAAAGH